MVPRHLQALSGKETSAAKDRVMILAWFLEFADEMIYLSDKPLKVGHLAILVVVYTILNGVSDYAKSCHDREERDRERRTREANRGGAGRDRREGP